MKSEAHTSLRNKRELCQRERIAQTPLPELSDIILYAQKHHTPEHINQLLSMVIMPWEVPDYHQLNDWHLVVKLRILLPQNEVYQHLSEEDKQALNKACEAIRTGL